MEPIKKYTEVCKISEVCICQFLIYLRKCIWADGLETLKRESSDRGLSRYEQQKKFEDNNLGNEKMFRASN